MIKLKNGYEIPFSRDFDAYFQELLESIVRESRRTASESDAAESSRNERFLKELMDNCIYVTHQLFELAKRQEDFSRFMVTGFIFNSILCCLPVLEGGTKSGESDPGSEDKIH